MSCAGSHSSRYTVEGRHRSYVWKYHLKYPMLQISQCKWVYCERKGPVGESLSFDTSWSKYLILKRLREKAQLEALAKAPTSKYTDAERDSYKKEIRRLQTCIIGNITRVLTLKQVKVLSGDKVVVSVEKFFSIFAVDNWFS